MSTLRTSGQDFLRVANSLPEPMLLVASGGTIVAANRRVLDRMGGGASALIGQALASVLVDPPERIAQYLRACAASGEPVLGSLTWRASEGEITCRCQGNVYAPGTQDTETLVMIRLVPQKVGKSRFSVLNDKIAALNREVHRRRCAEEELSRAQRVTAESLAVLDALVIDAPIGFAFVDRALRFGIVNSALAAHGGGPREAYLGRSAHETMPKLWPWLDSGVRRVFESGEPVLRVEMKAESAAFPGEARDWIASYYPVKIGDQMLGVGLVVSDVTELRRLEEYLRQAQRMEAIGSLAGGVAHDFNNLVTIMQGCVAVALESIGPDLPARAALLEIEKAAERAALLTGQLLAFSRKAPLALRVLDLNDSVRRSTSLLRRIIGEDIRISIELCGEPLRVRADPGQIDQILLNLASNARDAQPRGGELAIATRACVVDEHARAAHPDLATGPYAVLRVSDAGCGFDSATRARIFEPFFTTKAVGKGTGMGLATVYGIVRQSLGAIEVESEPGRGARFEIYLPRVELAPLAAEPAAAAPPAAPQRAQATILLVEDEPAVRRLASRFLRREGYTVHEARDTADAIRIAHAPREAEAPIDLLLTDVVMPGMSGGELASVLSRVQPSMKVLFMSGFAEEAVVRRSGVGAGSWLLQKPFTPSSLGAKVREVLRAPERPKAR